MRKLLERGRDRREAVRKVFRQASQIPRNLPGFFSPDDAVAVDCGRGQGRRGEDCVPVPLLCLARSWSPDSSQTFVGDGSSHP